MDLLKQCQTWSEQEEYEKIIETLTSIPIEERTVDLTMELARAYMYVGPEEDKEGLERGLELLLPIKEEMQENPRWQYRVGYAYFYLNKEALAFSYLKKAALHWPKDKHLAEMLDYCRRAMSLPAFEKSFREKTQLAWCAFAEREAKIRALVDKDKHQAENEALIALVRESLDLVFDDISFEVGFNGTQYELILSAEGDRVRLFALDYFAKRAPQSVLAHWNILVGRRGLQSIALDVQDIQISGDDVQVQVEKTEDNHIGLTFYCEKLLPAYAKEEDLVWWILANLTDQYLGELTAMAYIEGFEVVTTPLSDEAVLLSALPDKLEKLGLPLINDPAQLLENFSMYELEPDENPDADWRFDTVVGSTNCYPLLQGYFENDNTVMQELYDDGVAAGFLIYPLEELQDETDSNRVFDFRESLENYLEETCGEDIVYLTGGATGVYCGYIDFIAWDLIAVLQAAEEFFKKHSLAYAAFHTFVREAETVGVYPSEEPSGILN